MKSILIIGLLSCTAQLSADSTASIEERIEQCESERRELRAQILASPYFANANQNSGDEIEALIYSVGNFLSNGLEGRQIASTSSLDDSEIANFRAFIRNRNELNILYLERSQLRSQ